MINKKPIIYFRADGNSSIGLGHIFRCLAIAEIVAAEIKTIFLGQNLGKELKEEISLYCDDVLELKEQAYTAEAEEIAQWLRADDIIVCDGYNFDTCYQNVIKSSGAKLICIDDIYKYHFVADVVINHAGGILPSSYSIESGTNLYLGPAYAIVRSVFWNKPNLSSRINNHVLVCLGGADPRNDVITVLKKAFEDHSSFYFHVVTGTAYQYEKELLFLIKNKSGIKHYKSLDAFSMRALMQQCGVAICSPSTVSYEYLSIGGILYLYPIADNQVDIYNHFINSGLAFRFDDFHKKSRAEIETILQNQELTFDGKSYERIKEAIFNG